MKKFVCALLAMAISLSLFSGCAFVGGSDGRDGRDLNIYDIYAAVNEERQNSGLDQLDFLSFIKEYFNGVAIEYSPQNSLSAFINRSVLSGVAILTGYQYRPSRFSAARTVYYSGSGVVVDKDEAAGKAYIVTNCHVVYCDITNGESENVPNNHIADPVFADEIYIYLYGNDQILETSDITAQIICASVAYDIALLSVDLASLGNAEVLPAQFADEEEVYPGATVYAVGNPDGAGLSVTAGIISRESEAIQVSSIDSSGEYDEFRVIRTDAAINGGNSGGGLFDSSGRLVGIVNSKMASTSESIENIGYALCGSYVKRLWKLMRDTGGGTDSTGLERAVFPTDYEYTSTAYYNSDSSRVMIEDKVTVARSASDLKAGDVLQKISVTDALGNLVDELEITRFFNVDDVLLSARKGYSVVYTVLRDGSSTSVTAQAEFKFCK